MNINIAAIMVFDNGTKKSIKNLQLLAPSSLADSSNSDVVKRGVRTLAWFVLVGWAIYPIGYMCMDGGWLNTALNWSSTNVDLWYNIADAINKIGFGLVVYNIAISESK